MGKIKILIKVYGELPYQINFKKIKKFKSSIFEVVGVDYFSLPAYQNGIDYVTIEDYVWDDVIQKEKNINLIFGITNAHLSGRFYSRLLNENRVIFSFSIIRSFLQERHIALENVVLKQLYAYSLAMLAKKSIAIEDICHNDTKCCLYDMNGDLSDVSATFFNPSICRSCEEFLSQKDVPENKIQLAKRELKKLKISLFYRMLEWIKNHPILFIVISFCFSVLSDFIASWLLNIITN